MNRCNGGIQFDLMLSHMGRNSFQNMITPHKFLEQGKKKFKIIIYNFRPLQNLMLILFDILIKILSFFHNVQIT